MQNHTFNKTQSSMSESFLSNLSLMSSRSATFVSNISNMSIRNLRIRQHLRSRLRRIKRIGKLESQKGKVHFGVSRLCNADIATFYFFKTLLQGIRQSVGCTAVLPMRSSPSLSLMIRSQRSRRIAHIAGLVNSVFPQNPNQNLQGSENVLASLLPPPPYRTSHLRVLILTFSLM